LDLKFTLTVERQFSEVTVRKYAATKGPYVRGVRVVPSFFYYMTFWGCETWGTLTVVKSSHSGLKLISRDSEVTELGLSAFTIKDNVIGLDITVDNESLGVQVDKSCGYLSEHILGN
jgi:hypothetical protein